MHYLKERTGSAGVDLQPALKTGLSQIYRYRGGCRLPYAPCQSDKIAIRLRSGACSGNLAAAAASAACNFLARCLALIRITTCWFVFFSTAVLVSMLFHRVVIAAARPGVSFGVEWICIRFHVLSRKLEDLIAHKGSSSKLCSALMQVKHRLA